MSSTAGGHFGDIIMLLNLVKNFRAKHGQIKLVLRTHSWTKSIMEDFVKTCGIDEVVDTPTSMSNELQCFGYNVNHKEPLKGHPYTISKEHVIEGFAKNLGVEADFESLEFKKPPFPFQGDFLTIHPQSLWSPYKNWPDERWEELCERFEKEKIKVLQIAGPGDRVIKNAHRIIGEGSAKMLFKMSVCAVANSRLHIATDTWTQHSLNIKWDGKRTKGLILWGSSNIVATGYKTNTNIVKNLKCQPCLKEDPKISTVPLGPCENKPRGIHECMDLISVDEVFNKAMSMW